ncbi:hypothetical protein X975_19891, partial [Stegodyphus mimosarum]
MTTSSVTISYSWFFVASFHSLLASSFLQPSLLINEVLNV